jgi:hypothetical protein
VRLKVSEAELAVADPVLGLMGMIFSAPCAQCFGFR